VWNLFNGLVFLICGALVYAHNTEMHDPAREITFSRMFGMEAIGSTETVALLLGLGMFFLGLGAFRWMTDQEIESAENANGNDIEADSVDPPVADEESS
jgi:hypothetical protein